MRNSVNSFRLFARSKRTLNPQAKPAKTGMWVFNGGGWCCKFLSKQMTYLANMTIVARKAVENTVFFTSDFRTRFGLKVNNTIFICGQLLRFPKQKL